MLLHVLVKELKWQHQTADVYAGSFFFFPKKVGSAMTLNLRFR